MAKKEAKRRRIYKILLFLPYFVGLFWTCLHPIVSVLTGELKCRGWFLDESAIETRFSTQQSQATIRLPGGSATLCEILDSSRSNQSRSNIWCSPNHANRFDIAVLVPLSNAIDPTDEAIVLVVPPPPANGNWYSSSFHYSLTQTMNKLADPVATPWLAKTVILVSPSSQTKGSTDRTLSLKETVSAFLDAYLGSKLSSMDTAAIAPLPPRYCQAILRNMIVVDLQDDSTTSTRQGAKTMPQTDLSILPQGRRGALPNLDLVTLVGKLYKGASFLNTRAYPSSTFLAHGYTQESKDMKQLISDKFVPVKPSKFETKAQIWANEMVDLGLFAYTLAAGPHPPHWPALDRGIDSLTLQVSFEGFHRKDPSLETVQILENIVRALSNLHERLHHSFVLYWLPSPEKFVSHMEYFLPTVLVLLPLATRAFGMILMDDLTEMHLTMIGRSFLVSLCSMAATALALLFGALLFGGGDGSSATSTSSSSGEDDTMWTNTCLLVLYGAVAALWRMTAIAKPDHDATTNEDETTRRSKSLQFAACATAAYLLVPIAFCHSALVYIPGMVLVPLLAFPDYSQLTTAKRLVLMGLWMLTAPPILMVPRFFPHYTIFIRFAYVPMHIQLLLLILPS
ncbi:unnamed protein product [Cylindrotheca closterium]|uniref:Uncharacterized protein n=1 Tax=Cylindrotheca closterium TaxID=2856 RepID=A0AAD2CQ03_9STRA|nr:unnamed protein product [Cylindrotheca closterium]